MEDVLIIDLYNLRDERAIEESSRKYQSYCQSIAYRILKNKEDAEECVLDTWMKAWNSIPPDQPESLGTYLGTITRNLSFDRFRSQKRQKRGSGEITLTLGELENVLSNTASPEKSVEKSELSNAINSFLATLPERDRNILLCRYYFVYTIKDIAKHHKTTKQHICNILSRTLVKLKDFLERENYL